VTKIKLDSAMANAAQDALTPHVARLYSSLGTRIVVIAELAAVERTQPAADEDKEAAVKLAIKHLEVAGGDQEEAVRQALRALHTQRTAYGTITEQQDIELSERTLAQCAGELNLIEAARLHVAIERWTDYARQAINNGKLTASELRHELTAVTEGLRATVFPDVLIKG
jgi:phosphoribosylformimino-5-aminoimidazole carboxamide ribonucleotide (ProFAR) isomerase